MIHYKKGVYHIPYLPIGKKQILTDILVKVNSERPFPYDQFIVGFMGSVGLEIDKSGNIYRPTKQEKAEGIAFGKSVAKAGMIASNGSLHGLPYFNTKGAKHAGGYTLGISASSSPDEVRKQVDEVRKHLRPGDSLDLPDKHKDMTWYLGIMHEGGFSEDLVQRDIYNVSATDIIVIMNGRWGSYHEATQGIETGRAVMPIIGSGQVADIIIDIYKGEKIKKDTGALILPTDPEHFDEQLAKAQQHAFDRWKKEGRVTNRFTSKAEALEQIIKKTA